MLDYYIVDFNLLNMSYFLLWFSDDKDALFKQNGVIVVCNSLDGLKKFAKTNKLHVYEGVTTYHLDDIAALIEHGSLNISYKKILDFWNISSDIAYTMDVSFLGDEDGLTLDIYNMLFYGTNPPTLKGDSDEIYEPEWDNEDIEELKKVLSDALNIISKYLIKQN